MTLLTRIQQRHLTIMQQSVETLEITRVLTQVQGVYNNGW